jgi:hypothetical protein
MAAVTITETESGAVQGSSRVVGSLQLVPTDYDLLRTVPQREVDGERVTATEPGVSSFEPLENPLESWPTDHRRVPPCRPVNRQLDRSMRPAGQNAPLSVFIFTMLSGCHVLAVYHQLTLICSKRTGCIGG